MRRRPLRGSALPMEDCGEPTKKHYFEKLLTASASELETSNTVSSLVICSSSLVLDPRLQSRSVAPPDFALECTATSAPSPELSIIVTFFRSRTSFFLPSPRRPFTFSRRATVSSPSTMRPSKASTATPSTSRFAIFRAMFVLPLSPKMIAQAAGAGPRNTPARVFVEFPGPAGSIHPFLFRRFLKVYRVGQHFLPRSASARVRHGPVAQASGVN